MLGNLGSSKRPCEFKGLLMITLIAATLLSVPLKPQAQGIYATTQDNGVVGICLLCGVANPTNAVSSNLNDYSTFDITVGLLGVSVYQDLIFPTVNADQGCDSLVINLGNNGGLLSATLLGGVSFETFNGSMPNNDLTGVSASILTLLTSDTTRGYVVLRPTKTFDRVRVTLNSSLVGALTDFRLYSAYWDKTTLTAPKISGADTVTTCSGTPVTLTATSTVAAATIKWFTQPTGGSAMDSGSTYTVTPTVTTTYYVEADLGSCVSPTRTPVTVQVNTPPVVPTLVNAALNVCSGNPATFSVSNPQAGITYNWYTVATGGTPVATGTTYTIASATTSTIVYVQAETGASGCVSATRAMATLTVNPTPVAPVISGSDSVTVSQGQTASFTISAPNPAYTYNWYDAPSGGDLVYTGTSFTTPAIYAPTSYYVFTVSNQGCTSPAATKVTVNVQTSDSISCGFATTQTSPIISGVCLLCTVSNGALAVDGNPSTASTITSTVGALGYVGQLLGFPNTYPAGDSIVLELAIPGQLVSATLLSGIQVTTYQGTTSNNDAQALNSTLIRLQLLGGGSQFRVILPTSHPFNGLLISINGTVSLLSNLMVYYGAALVPRPTAASTLINDCGPGIDTLKATGPAGATYNWYNVATAGTPLATGATYVTPLISSSTTYFLESSAFGCANSVRTPVQITVNTQPPAPTIGAPSVTICSGDSATLAATVPAGDTVKWYTLPSGGTAIDSGGAYTTPALTSTAVYYAASTLNGCASTVRTKDSVYVNPTPGAVTVSPGSTTISAGQSVTFNASSTSVGASFNWYTQLTGGTPIYTGASYTVSPATTTTYYVAGVFTATGCTTPTREAITVTVLTNGGPAVPCGAATTDTTAVSGICLGCSVQNAGLAVDANANTGSTMSVLAGLLGGNVQEMLIFPFTASAGDSIHIKFALPTALVSTAALGSIEVGTFDGNNFNNDLQPVTSSLIKLNLLSGNDSAIISFAPTAAYDRVLVQLNSGVASLLTTVNVDYATSTKSAPTLQADTVSVCSGNQATLQVIAPTGATFNWYTAATGGTPIYTGATYTTPVLTDTTVYYVQSTATNDGCVNTMRTPAVVNVPAPPAAPAVASNSVSVCMGSTAKLIATPPPGDTVYWFTAPTGGVSIAKGDTLITPALDSSKTYYAGAGNPTGCSSISRTSVSVSVVTPPTAPTVTPASDTICAGGSVQLVASSKTTGVQFYWFNSVTSTDTLFTGATYTTPVIDSSATYYVAASAGACSSSTRTSAMVVVNPRPVAPTVTVNPASGTINSGSTVSMTATSSTPNTSFNWYTVSTGGSPVYTGASYTTPALTNTVTYYVESEGNNGGGCSSATRTAVTITVVPAINVTCGLATSQTNAANGLCVGCSLSNAGSAVDLDTTTYSTLNVTAGLLGANISQTLIFPEVSQPGDSVYIELGTGSTLLSAGVLSAIQVSSANGATSNNDAQTLQSSAVKVNLLAGGSKALISFAPSASYDRVTVTVSSGIVSALTAVNIYYASDMVSQPIVTSTNPSICAGTKATLSATSSPNAKVEWFSSSTGGTPIGYGDTLVTPALTSTTTYYAEALRKSDSCANTNRVPVTVNVLAAPAVPVALNNPDTICSGSTAILQAQSASGITINWYSASTGGTLLYTGNVYTTPALTANTSYFASASNGTCSSVTRDSVAVIVGQSPAVPVVLPSDTGICAGIPVTLNVSQPQSGVVYNWYTVLSGGTPVYTGTSFTTPTLTASVTYYVEAVNAASKCSAPSARTAVTIIVTPVPTAPSVAASTIAVCSGQPATAAVSNPVSGMVYQWYDAATAGILLYTGPTYTVSAVSSSTTLYVQATSASGCSSSARTAVVITADSTPAVPQVVASNVAICSGAMAMFTVASPQAGVTYNWYGTPTGGSPLATGTTYTTLPLTASATYYLEADNASGCSASSSRTVVNANVTSAPAAPIVALSPVTICSGGMASLSVQNPQGGIVYDWYDAATGGTQLAQGSSFTTPALTTGTTYYVAAVNGLLSCASSSRTADSVAIGSQPSTPTLVSSAVVVCSGGTATLQVSSPQPGINYNWYTSTTSTTPVYIGTAYSIPDDTTSATYYVQGSTSGGCTSASEASGSVSVNAAPGNPTVAVPDLTVCTNTSATFAISNPVAGYTYSWYASPAGSAGGAALAVGTVFTTPALSVNETYYVGASTSTSCTSQSLTTVEAIVTNNLSAPTLVSGTTGTCSGQSAVLAVSNPIGGIIYNWYSASTGGSLIYTGPSYTIANPTASDTLYVDASASSGTCSSATRTEAILTVNSVPAAPTLVTSGATVCSGGNTTLQVANPVSGYTYNWYTSASGGTPVYTGDVYNLTDVTKSTEYYVSSDDNGCNSANRTPVTVDLSAAASMPTVTAASSGVCPGDDDVLTATSTTSGAVFTWYTIASGGTAVATGSSFTTGPLISDTTFYVQASSAAGCTDSSARASIALTTLQALAAPTVTIQTRTPTSVTFQWAPVPGAEAYQVSLDSGLTWVTPSSGPTGTTETINGLLPNQQTTIEVKAIGQNACQSSVASAKASGYSENPLGDNIFVPNIFSPNGDGVNDILYVYSNAIASLVFRVYNQWGQEVFESRNQSTGWDGTMGGQKQPIGVYIYVLSANMQDGTIVNKKGSVTLIR